MSDSWFLFVQRLYLFMGVIWNVATAAGCVLFLVMLFNEEPITTVLWGYFAINFAYILINWLGHAFAHGVCWVITGRPIFPNFLTGHYFSAFVLATVLGPLSIVLDLVVSRAAKAANNESINKLATTVGVSPSEFRDRLQVVVSRNPKATVEDVVESFNS